MTMSERSVCPRCNGAGSIRGVPEVQRREAIPCSECMRTGADALTHHKRFDLEAAIGAATRAAAAALVEAGMNQPDVIVNVGWREGGMEFVAGSAVPKGIVPFIADSLRETALEVEEANGV